ncbi:type I-D CRISPR-associated helicase Cas3' [Kallotenue papyrolyticum]|uniref:type I-D CRISPR-associated helicase Cas3' n=1 Tax=Kallotenue papyrolyticum TaxID=1325125 RepID=UPI00049295F4|nr:type I-D CRISPR-associated helicase Cas3' [Kallotenue papyrolyticum]
MHLHILPVFSRLADPGAIPASIAERLPSGLALSQHQWATYQALTASDADVVINTALTGDGKSLAVYLPTLLDAERGAFGMYPTNELARDQQRQVEHYVRDFGAELRYTDLWGGKLARLLAQHESFARRAELLAALLSDYRVVLTNPDIFHLMINYRYRSPILSLQELMATLQANFTDFIFDEFHVFQAPQITAAVTGLLALRTLARPHSAYRPRFVFLSATPGSALGRMLHATGLRVAEIGGDYVSASRPGYRQVLHALSLHLHQRALEESAEAWIARHLDLIRAHFAEVPNARGAIIVTSVVEARRIVRLLRERLPQLRIGENTGLTDEARRRAAMAEAELIVGTSTIDVGVDFHISLLIFEAGDAGTFWQRLGRLGRVRRDGSCYARYEAHALFSGTTPWIYEQLIRALQEQGLEDGAAVERPTTLRAAVEAAFPQATAFERYQRRWGALQAAHIIATLEQPQLGGAYAEAAARLRQQYQQTFGLRSITSVLGRYRRLVHGANQTNSTACRAILDQILTFRGSSPFQVAVWDRSVEPPALLSYDALALAQSSQLQLADWAVVEQELERRLPDAAERDALLAQWAYLLQYEDHPLVLLVEQFLEERERLVLQLDRFDSRTQCDQVLLLSGLSIKQPCSLPIQRLNAVLRRQRVVVYVTRREAAELRRRLRLPALFPLYRAEDNRDRAYTLALGQAALLLEAEALVLRSRDEEDAPLIY